METIFPTTTTDIIILVILSLSAIFAFIRGFVREILALVAWVGAGFITIYFLNSVDHFFFQFVHNKVVANILAAFSLFLISLIIFSMAAHFISSMIKKTPIGPIDRFLGMVFGLLRGVLFICLFYIFILWFQKDKPLPQWLREAQYRPFIEKTSEFFINIVPEKQQKEFLKMLRKEISHVTDNGLLTGSSIPSDFTDSHRETHSSPASQDISKPEKSSENSNNIDANYEKNTRDTMNDLIKDNATEE